MIGPTLRVAFWNYAVVAAWSPQSSLAASKSLSSDSALDKLMSWGLEAKNPLLRNMPTPMATCAEMTSAAMQPVWKAFPARSRVSELGKDDMSSACFGPDRPQYQPGTGV